LQRLFRWSFRGYAGIELRLIDGHLIDLSMPVAERTRVRQTIATAGLSAREDMCRCAPLGRWRGSCRAK
jgi:hypothetical protein